MIGFYDYTVIMTYISVVSSMIGIFCAVTDHISAAVCCLAFSGLCDMFDGKIARTKKNRTEEEKCFGIQIDSLADIVCFGILPIVLGFKLGMCHIYGIAILLFYGLAGLIRLAYFNVMEEKRQNETSENRKYYQGLPITSMSVVLPLLFVVSLLFPEYKWFVVLLHIAMLTVGLLFILDFKFRKPTNRELVIIVAVVAWQSFLYFSTTKDGGSSIISISFPWREVVIYDPDSGQNGAYYRGGFLSEQPSGKNLWFCSRTHADPAAGHSCCFHCHGKASGFQAFGSSGETLYTVQSSGYE